MRLRSVIILVSSIGAGAAFLLALDIHRRVEAARHDALVSNALPGADSVLNFGEIHLIGLLGLAFLFLAVVLLMLVDIPKVETFTPAAPRDDGTVAIVKTTSLECAKSETELEKFDAPIEIPPETPPTSHLSGENAIPPVN